ncbi:hypothetical protein HGB25_01230 [Candidatus Saccharibacteria bacterium]|nr:hypothetical protein [Candidatus Saccharibacteria bacterium]
METVQNDEANQNEVRLDTWNQQRSTEQLFGLIARREAVVADYSLDL